MFLYFGSVLRFNPEEPDWSRRDRFILSKGHAALAEASYFSTDRLSTLRQSGESAGLCYLLYLYCIFFLYHCLSS